MVAHLIRLARPQHWIKNVVVLLPVFTAMRAGDAGAWAAAAVAAAAFCLAASAAYVFNDLADRRQDAFHPRKCGRPIASGAVPAGAAAAEGAVLLAGSLALALAAGPPVAAAILAYHILQALYSYWLHDKMLLDVICIALGFVLRAVAGAVAIGVWISPWLFICTFTLCLFLGFCKRSSEIATLGDSEEARRHRKTLGGYSPELLTHLITLSAAVAVVAFLMYATSEGTIRNYRTGYPYLVLTLPLVVYGVFRFAMLSLRGSYADPVELILRDRPFQLAAVLWAAMAVAVIRLAPLVERTLGTGR